MQSTSTAFLILNFVFQYAGIFIAAVLLGLLAWNAWMNYVQTDFLNSIKWSVLEVKPPKEVMKSPAAMELVLQVLYQKGGVGTWIDTYWKGQVLNWFSLEVVSLEGAIHFYIRTPSKFIKIIQAQIYSQYPQAEVFEVEDYVKKFPDYVPGGPINVWGCNFVLTKDDPFPIKTYVDYGLDRAVGSLDEEQRIDPISVMLEFMGSLGAGQNVMFQILIRADTKRFTVKSEKIGKDAEGKETKTVTIETGKEWKDKAVKEIIPALRKEFPASGRPTKGQSDVVDAVERSATKFGFDSAMRVVYLCKKDNFNADLIPGITGMLRQYDGGPLNSFRPDGVTNVDYSAWKDTLGNKLNKQKTDLWDAYRGRGFFYSGFEFDKIKKYFSYPSVRGGKPFILNTEELATLFHLPGRVVETPTFTRIEATKAEPPHNLPV